MYLPKLLDVYFTDTSTKLKLPLVENGISAGFPSPADDFLDSSIDLNKAFIKNKLATFFARVKGNSMKDVGIDEGDLLIVDKSLEPKDKKIAVCFIDGEFTVKRIKIEKDVIWLIAENKAYSPIKVTKDNDFIIWGIVTNVIKSF
ncbi:MAG: translesion error-prone DNA polymerase V autoproteolytic subunit [Brumimicrobium sp.]